MEGKELEELKKIEFGSKKFKKLPDFRITEMVYIHAVYPSVESFGKIYTI